MTITIEGLIKEYHKGVQALKGVDLVIEKGMFGLLGPNGAGKTTLMRILATLMDLTKGSVKIGGLDIKKDRSKIRELLGYLPQNFSTFSKLKTWEFLDYSALLAGLKNKKIRRTAIEKMLETVGLYDARNRHANKLSGGMKRRLGIAQALIGDPKLLIIDEPTTGLDPAERLRFRNLMSKMSLKDIIIILSTHIVGDISSSCNRMAILNNGRVAYEGSPDDLISKTRGHVWTIQAQDAELSVLKEKFSVVSSAPTTDGYEVQVVGNDISGFEGIPVEPNIEHAYVYFLEHSSENSVHEKVI
ncbi:ABC transporter ATP-binding protein [candidate division KSB1 bacterium]|nr:ABC transporter ATP-binding protein [candidate division KSB1 bacterium]